MKKRLDAPCSFGMILTARVMNLRLLSRICHGSTSSPLLPSSSAFFTAAMSQMCTLRPPIAQTILVFDTERA